jgi:hypothetical protein
MLIGIGFAVALIVAVAALRVVRTHGRQHNNRILRDHVRRTY